MRCIRGQHGGAARVEPQGQRTFFSRSKFCSPHNPQDRTENAKPLVPAGKQGDGTSAPVGAPLLVPIVAPLCPQPVPGREGHGGPRPGRGPAAFAPADACFIRHQIVCSSSPPDPRIAQNVPPGKRSVGVVGSHPCNGCLLCTSPRSAYPCREGDTALQTRSIQR